METGEPLRFHTNAMAAYGGPFDLTLDFGYRARPEEDPEVGVRLTMSWEHALATVKALQVMVDSYQEQIGATLPDLGTLKEDTP